MTDSVQVPRTDPRSASLLDQRDRFEQEDDAVSNPWRTRAIPLAVGIAVVTIIAVVIKYFPSGDEMPPPRRIQEVTVVKLVPPPPPPPPPPKPREEKMIEQTPVKQEFREETPVETPKDAPRPKDAPKSDEPPPGPLALDAKATGPGDSFNLGGKPGGHGLIGGGGGGGNGGGGGSRWGWYASIVQQQLESALRTNAKTRNVVMQLQVRMWVDASGRISRVQLVSSTGNPEIDSAIRNEVLPGITFREPPPKDMPMPVVARISARRPT